MKELIKVLGVLFIFLLSLTNHGICDQITDNQICVVDVQYIFQNSDSQKDAKIQLENKQTEMKKKLDRAKKKIELLKDSLGQESMILNKKTLAEKEREIRIQSNDLKMLRIKFQEELDILQQKLIYTIEKSIIDIASKIGKSEGYSIVLNKSAILYSQKITDITNKVLNEYNNEYSSKKIIN